MILADISTGNTETADVFFLVALVVFLVAAVAYFIPRKPHDATVEPYKNPHDAAAYAPVLLAIGLACVSLAWLVL